MRAPARRPRAFVLVAPLALALVAAACGGAGAAAGGSGASSDSGAGAGSGGSTPAAPAQTAEAGGGASLDDICSFIPTADLEAAGGQKIKQATDESDSSKKSCVWDFQGPDGLDTGSQVSLEIDGDGPATYDTMDGMFDFTPVDGVGDKAGWGPGGALFAVKGDKLVIVQVLIVKTGDLSPDDVTKQLMEGVLAKL